MENFSISHARSMLGELLNRVRIGGQRIVLSSHGKDVGAIISMEELKILQLLEDQMDIAAHKKAMNEPEGFISAEDFFNQTNE
ncbi:MAG: type II toxin-antitoxin system prevent-host-death family antitoxin [Phycisphaerae bacterium]|nr:type II toxin-antitoxin system prevent-host-death family antitoxin [Phycisphaerae bacterium]